MKIVKRTILILFFVISAIVGRGQWFSVPNQTTFDDRTIHFGFTLGINTLDMKFQHFNTIYDNPLFNSDSLGKLPEFIQEEINAVGGVLRADIQTLTPGFTVGIVSNLRLTESLDLRFIPGLSFGTRRIIYNIPVHDANRPGTESFQSSATFLDFPLLVKYKSKRLINHRPYTIAGVAFRYDISKPANVELLQINKALFSIEAGMGWDLYLQFFRLSTELKYSFGIGNSLKDTPPGAPQYPQYHLALKRLTSNVVTLSFHFE